MATPIIEFIATDIKDAINEITVANGFNQTLIAVRPKRVDFRTAWTDLTVLVNQVESEELTSNGLAKTWRQYFLIVALVIDSDDATASIDTRLNQVRSDIDKKLQEDVTRGGYGFETVTHESTPFDDDTGGPGGVALKISVDYRTLIDDPYTLA